MNYELQSCRRETMLVGNHSCYCFIPGSQVLVKACDSLPEMLEVWD